MSTRSGRRRRSFAQAELAERSNRDPALHMRPCSARKASIARFSSASIRPLRQHIGAPGPVGVETTRQQIEADGKHLLGGEIARPVQNTPRNLPLRRTGISARPPIASSSKLKSKSRLPGWVNRSVEHVQPRTLRDYLRQSWGAPEDVAEQLAQGAVRTQDRQEFDTSRGHALASASSKAESAASASPDPCVGFEQRRRQICEVSTCRARGAAEPRRVGQNASREPFPLRLPGAGKSKNAQSGKRCWTASATPVKIEIARGDAESPGASSNRRA